NAIVIQEDIYDDVIQEMENNGAYLCDLSEKEKIQNVLWKDKNLNADIICKPATYITEQSGFEIPGDRTWLIVEEEGYGSDYPFSGEKLSVVVALYKYKTVDDAIKLVNNIQEYSGAGQSCGIHSKNDERIHEYSLKTKTSRVAVNLPVNK